MKIGILTTHDSTNYGANLQAYALYRVLSDMGHNVILIDRRRNPQGLALKYPFSSERLLKRIWRTVGMTGVVQEKIHALNTYRFQRRNMTMSSYHFHDWKDAPADMGIDLLVVGSDQIWNRRINNPLDYMPTRFPKGLPAITYAASIGMPDVPTDLVDDFKKWIPQFKAVSVREPNLLLSLSKIGIAAKHVADPVVLFGAENWRKFIGNVKPEMGRTFVYAFWGDLMGLKNDITRCTDGNVDIFPCQHFIDVPSCKRPWSVLRNLLYWMRLHRGRRVHVRLMAGPKEYLRSLMRSESVVTNSFHGFILGVLLGKNVRYVVPASTNKEHSDMMGRIIGYVDKFIHGPILQPSWESAFSSINCGEQIKVDFAGLESFQKESRDWLQKAIVAVTEKT